MKPKNLPIFPGACLVAVSCIFISGAVRGATIVKADNADPLQTGTSWVGGVVPTAADIGQWDATVSGANNVPLAANLSVSGLRIADPGGAVGISGTGVLTLGTGGIDMGSATANLTIANPITLANGHQIWNVAPGRTLATGALPNKPGQPLANNAGVLELSTTGSIVLGLNTANLIVDNQGNPFATFGKNDWAGTSGGTVVASTYTEASTGLTGGVVNDIIAPLTGANGVDVQALRFNAAEPYDLTVSNSGTARTMTARGILVTENSGGGSIGGNLRTNGFIRPARSSTAAASFNVIQHSSADFTIGANITNASSNTPVKLVKSGNGRLILLSNNGYTGGTHISGGAVQFGNGGTVGFPGGGDIVNHGTLEFHRSDTVTLINNISGPGSLIQRGPGELALTTSVSTFTGPVSILGGTLGVTAMDNLGTGSSIIMNGGAFKFLAVVDPSVRSITFGENGGGFDTNGLAVTLASSIGNSGSGGLTKTGTGSLTLAAANDFSGPSTVSAGTLIAANASGSATGSGALTIAAGGTLGGTGSIGGNVTAQTGSTIAPGSGVGTLSLASLTLEEGSTLEIEFSGTPANDQLNITQSGGLTLSGGSVRLLEAGGSVAFITPGTYNLIAHSGAIGGSGLASLSVANPQPGLSYSFGQSGGFVTLTVATTGVVRSWTNDGSGTWDDAANWNGSVPNSSGATANFNTPLTAPATIALSAPRTIGALTFNSAAHGYTLAATGSGSLTLNNGGSEANVINSAGNHTISAPVTLASATRVNAALAADSLTFGGVVSGSGAMEKAGPGSLSLLSPNTFSGGLTLKGGTTRFASGGLGSGPLSITDSTLVWADGNTQDISNRLISIPSGTATFEIGGNVTLAQSIGNSGDGALVKTGDGTLTLASDASYAGLTTISAGALQLGNGGSAGSVGGDIVNNAALIINRSGIFNMPNAISGTGTLSKLGSGELILESASTFTGVTTLQAGTLTLGNDLALQNSTLKYDAGTLDLGLLFSATLGGLDGSLDISLENEFTDPVALTIGGNGVQTLYSGDISGPGSLTKTGTGITTFTGTHSYLGATIVNGGGALELDQNASINGGPLTVTGTSRFVIYQGSLTALGLSNISNAGTTAPLFEIYDGSATFDGGLNALGNQNFNYLIRLYGGTVTASSVSLGRTALNYSAEPTEGSLTSGIYLNGGSMSITGALDMGIGAGSNSSVSVRIDDGNFSVAGPVTVGLNNGGRWSVIDVNGGTFTSTDEAFGTILGGPLVGNSALLVRNGVAKIQRVQFGQGETTGIGVLQVSGGSLYLGAGGIVAGSTGEFVETIRLRSGVLGALADWSTSLPVTLTAAAATDETPAGEFTIHAADAENVAKNITLDGGLSGNAALTKTGGGTLTLGGGHAFTGSVSVEEGTLALNTATLDDASAVSVSSGATLALNFTGKDSIASLTLDGVVRTSGDWGAPGSGADNTSPLLSGSGILSIGGGGSPFGNWAAANGLNGADALSTADPDQDGRSNLIEFALDGNPALGTASGKERSGVIDLAGTKAHVLTLPVRDGAVFGGTTALSATLDGVVYHIEGSLDLTTFAQAVVEITPAQAAGLPVLNAGWSYRSFRLASAVSAATPRGFLRVRIVEAP